ncbi:MAG: hypothetical protein KKD47_10365, partial [Proteobacteria bacterium]|nr:hypothetical protein [Pseudomonadota bacterium]
MKCQCCFKTSRLTKTFLKVFRQDQQARPASFGATHRWDALYRINQVWARDWQDIANRPEAGQAIGRWPGKPITHHPSPITPYFLAARFSRISTA